MLVGWLETKTERVSGYALVYIGLTGVGFWDAATRGLVLVGSGRTRDVPEAAQQRQGRGRGQGQNRNAGAVPVNVKKRFSAERMSLPLLITNNSGYLPVAFSSTCIVDDFSSHSYFPICVDHLPFCRTYVECTP